MSSTTELSVIIPVLNEEENLVELYPKLKGVLDGLNRMYEIIFIDDGSTDNTFATLEKIHEKDKNVKVIRFRKNFGQTAAISAGFNYAKGGIIVTMDGDLQNDPGDIPLLLRNIEEGYDVVNGWRIDRKDPLLKKIPSRFSNWLARYLTKVEIHDFGCTLKAYRRGAVEKIELYGEMHRYIPALLSWRGFKITEIKVSHHPRRHGETKYGNWRLVKGFLDLINLKFWTQYSTRPLHFFGVLGLVQFIVGFLIGVYLSVIRLFFGVSIADRPLLLLAVLLVILGVQFITFGFLSEIVVRIYYDKMGRKSFEIERSLTDE
ncbi:MAG: glycosyltransferase family 2 protein [Candidatus Hydrothermarchaeales archaeon]